MKAFFSKVWEAVLCFVSGVMVLFACNPISMFVFNLFFPENAARFVREFIGFNDFWRNFYTRNALKWPYWWAQHWITIENLHLCGVRKQVAYYLENPNRETVIKAMSPKAQVYLVRKYPEKIEEIGGLMRLTDAMFTELLKQLVKKDHKPHPYSNYGKALYTQLRNYLQQGKLPFSQVMIMTRVAVAEYSNYSCPLTECLHEYIERFGLSKKQLGEIAQYMCDTLYWRDTFAEEPTTEAEREYAKQRKFNHFYAPLSERQENYEQRMFARSHRLSHQTEEWKTFCADKAYICPAAQKEMDINQYHVFHDAGHNLSTEAIVYFLRYPNRMLHRLVFRYEPLDVFENVDVQHVINGNIYLKDVFKEETAKRMLDKEIRKASEKSDTDGRVGGKLLI